MDKKTYGDILNKVSLRGHIIRSLVWSLIIISIFKLLGDGFTPKELIRFFGFVMVWELIASFVSKHAKLYHIRSAVSNTILAIAVIVATYGPTLLHDFKLL